MKFDRDQFSASPVDCNRLADAHRYHDGELRGEELASFEAHMRECGACDSLLLGLRHMSQLLARFQQPAPSDAWLESIGDQWAVEARETGVRRLAGWMTSAAAAVLAGAMLWSPAVHTDNEENAISSASASWAEAVAVMPPTRTRDDSGGHLVQVAQWMADDLSVGEQW